MTQWSQPQQEAAAALNAAIEQSSASADGLLWEALRCFAGVPFRTAKGLVFTYAIKGGEMFVDRKDKSITESSVMIAFHQALALGRNVSGPKKLGTFGASYLYPIFLQLGVIQTTEKAPRRRKCAKKNGSPS